MEWVLRSPQIHSTFGNLGFTHGDGYHVNENCNAALETILHNILTEDKYLRSYRKSIRFGENIKKDLIPLLINAKNDTTLELLIKILLNLTIPVECLLSVELISQTDFGRHTVFEINNLLTATKAAFTDHRTTRVIIDFLKKYLDNEQKSKLSMEQCTNISNCLLLLRNILHIPEDNSGQSPSYNGTNSSVQNQILWNIFSQSIDKVLIKLMVMPDATYWGVTMVQLIALLYKDQHVVTLHKLLNLWLEASLSESSDDNESNTSPPDRGSEDSSPMLTSDPTSDSSDTGGSGKSNDEPNSVNNGWDSTASMNNISENGNQPYQETTLAETKVTIQDKSDSIENTVESQKSDDDTHTSLGEKKAKNLSEQSSHAQPDKKSEKTPVSEASDCGYGTQMEVQESISTSSNEDELPTKKPVHQKPHNPKQRANNKVRSGVMLQYRKRKKIVKRGKTNTINIQGLSHKTPTDDDISNIMKEFTVVFLLKGYNSLVQTLHDQILTNKQVEIDTSHFFWLVTYFLKFATQIELDLEHVCSVLTYDIVSYLTAEGVNLCEQFELAIKLDGNDLKPSLRRLHLVVTAIREFVQAMEIYKKLGHMCKDDQETLLKLQVKMCETEELRSLLVLLLRYYDPKYHSKQYLQDLIVTNHNLLMFLDSVMKLPEYSGSTNMNDHIRQFATPEIMFQYGLLLEDYASNGEFVNDCIFTLMHHVGGELDSLITLFQPKILKTFTSIWKSEFEICDDWSDLIEYVINTFIKKPHTLQSNTNFRLTTECFDDDKIFVKPVATPIKVVKQNIHNKAKKDVSPSPDSSKDNWTEEELSSLSWLYMQCSSLSDVIGEIIKLYKEDGIIKTRSSLIKELLKQNLINDDEYKQYQQQETERTAKILQVHEVARDDEISKLCDHLKNDGKSKFLDWVQKVLLDTCFAKHYIEKKNNEQIETPAENKEFKLMNFELFKKKSSRLPEMSPVSYHSLLLNQSVPLVPWNCEQASICKDLKFLQLLHKLGFHMPVDSGKVFIRIPHFWTSNFLCEVASKISPIDTSKLKFSLDDVLNDATPCTQNSFRIPSGLVSDITMIETPDNFYQQKHLAAMVNYTPMPGSSFNPENEELHRQNWLDVVQKSQEYNMSLGMGSSLVEKDERCMDAAMQRTAADVIVATPTPLLDDLRNTPTLMSVSSLVMPPIMSMKQDNSNYHLNLAESEYYNNSVCETASVTSNLTRMYMSDEDDKEVLINPVIDVSTMLDDQFSSDSESTIAEKRPRVEF
ncbi:protein timeless [Amyelois transitella]|uniref:protein timeless n=1 Tax=Amyelois transitella TaxID=680683 RepID=UPI00067ADE5A|nr:protein timeless [Amyelois transitella]XP_013200571.1 protein timeless [Amyelois transitella]XP_060802630.1 protein timeless [Amyelois transitella]